MPASILDPALQAAFSAIQSSFRKNATKTIQVNGRPTTIPYPFPSPTDWRDTWLYFLMIDRFSNLPTPPASTTANPPAAWDQPYGGRQGGTFNGIKDQLDYLANLGAGAIWITPVLKNSMVASWSFNYHGYGIQDFLSIDRRFASDNTEITAEHELQQLIEAAHARGIYVILDIVINHSAHVFDYEVYGTLKDDFKDPAIMQTRPGSEPPIEWLDSQGNPQPDWSDPATAHPGADDAVWPSDLLRADLFRRRGNRLSDTIPGDSNFIMGDFDVFRQVVMEYLADTPGLRDLRLRYGKLPVLNIFVMIYWYLMAKFDIDGYRIDTVKYVDPDKVEQFGNAMREFAFSIGKKNFFTFGEIWESSDQTIQNFIGRNSTDGFGIDAALDYPLFNVLPGFAKEQIPVEAVRTVFQRRKDAEQKKLSSHGEAGQYFVSFLDNHDQNRRFRQPGTLEPQVTLGLAILFGLQGIPCVYYGTEQGLQGTGPTGYKDGEPQYSLECSREALWGKAGAFDATAPMYKNLQALAQLRNNEAALQYGRLYFRELSGNGRDFGLSMGTGGVLAFSRILAAREVIIVANASTSKTFQGFALADPDTNRGLPSYTVAYSNLGTNGTGKMEYFAAVNFYNGAQVSVAEAVALYIVLAPMEVQILVPA
ncbi:MAG TPA: alpha-amylase family glycosyl hydrolase [Puia sp.]|jgi:glycosidase